MDSFAWTVAGIVFVIFILVVVSFVNRIDDHLIEIKKQLIALNGKGKL